MTEKDPSQDMPAPVSPATARKRVEKAELAALYRRCPGMEATDKIRAWLDRPEQVKAGILDHGGHFYPYMMISMPEAWEAEQARTDTRDANE
jgi:hypothetical protein